ncbi:agmatine deiminase [Arthrobacter sp. YC-RL1]|uniref:Agmatine deiminase family protein n=1 Tax=Glutamicibacter soli TaxID=453836 RepID=A0A365YGC6_9MICC|nr:MULTISPECIES: agmatine deiminase family protein [Micrococcaceae]ALD65015.1 agmatine deiminase [Arthrobacter sp. LS16]ALQ29604.1 agmatine deiminase [Arthrobacter sp. YC-RL1]KLI89031.1 agmatine deiminase [Arthrobacter sp. YC-RL1]RBM01761.1 agmatine deiminase family protein [Glutamicibacter soli]
MSEFLMPAETDPHERIYMAFPSGGYTLGDTAEEAEAARSTWAAVAKAVARFTPVTMVVDPQAESDARRHLGEEVSYALRELDDAWMRDIGPTFVRDASGELAAIDWNFNGWGAQSWASWGKDSKIAAQVAQLEQTARVQSSITNEGGGIHVDGEGTMLATRSVQLDPGRNPEASAADIEAEFAKQLGAQKVIWLERGLTRDNEEFGTRGHVDIVACFAEPGVVLYHDQQDPAHPDHAISAEVRSLLEAATDAKGRKLRLVPVPAPKTLKDEEGWVDYSYINHLVTNGGVIACCFNDENDAQAARILAQAYPGREVVAVDATELYARGGGIHCITQQVPKR